MNAETMNAEERHAEFMNTLAHDLQQPLFALSGYLELLTESESLGDGEQMLVERAVANVQHLADIVEGVRAEASAAVAARKGSGPVTAPG